MAAVVVSCCACRLSFDDLRICIYVDCVYIHRYSLTYWFWESVWKPIVGFHRSNGSWCVPPSCWWVTYLYICRYVCIYTYTLTYLWDFQRSNGSRCVPPSCWLLCALGRWNTSSNPTRHVENAFCKLTVDFGNHSNGSRCVPPSCWLLRPLGRRNTSSNPTRHFGSVLWAWKRIGWGQ